MFEDELDLWGQRFCRWVRHGCAAALVALSCIVPVNVEAGDQCDDGHGNRGKPVMPHCFEYAGGRFDKDDVKRGAYLIGGIMLAAFLISRARRIP